MSGGSIAERLAEACAAEAADRTRLAFESSRDQIAPDSLHDLLIRHTKMRRWQENP